MAGNNVHRTDSTPETRLARRLADLEAPQPREAGASISTTTVYGPVSIGDFGAAFKPVLNQTYYLQVVIPVYSIITGARYWIGTTAAGTVRSSLYNRKGVRVGNRTTNLAVGANNTPQDVAFDAAVACKPGTYYIALTFQTAEPMLYNGTTISPAGNAAGPGAGATKVEIVPPTAPANTIKMAAY